MDSRQTQPILITHPPESNPKSTPHKDLLVAAIFIPAFVKSGHITGKIPETPESKTSGFCRDSRIARKSTSGQIFVGSYIRPPFFPKKKGRPNISLHHC
jgi:hypothetical protein